jgi:tryptophan-rich sensory protein
MTLSRRLAKPMAVAALAALLVATLGTTVTDIGPWYRALAKPSWQPPDWLFGPVWTIIYALAALSAATAWRNAHGSDRREWIIVLFALNGFLNVLWSLMFFRLQRPDWALAEVALLWLSVLLLIIYLRPFTHAGLLLWPYLAWVSFAALLNLSIVQLNGPFGG